VDVLVAGAGFLGCALAERVAAGGDRVVLASRGAVAAADRRRLDIGDRAACRQVVRDVRPDALVLVHGPSDVTWCERHPEEATAVHAGGAANLGRAAGAIPTLLISTDNVFAGDQARPVETDRARPANAYGAAKRAAEEIVLAAPGALVLRCSLVYGLAAAGRSNFFADTAAALERGDVVRAPHDQWTTPVLVDDVAAWVAALLHAGTAGVLHLGGPERLSRSDWARLIAARLGADPALVVPVARATTRYACRPENTCLASGRRVAALDGLPPRGVHAAMAYLHAARAA